MAGESRGNWGRWGGEDELGALNLVDDAKRLAALSAPRAGRVYSLAHTVDRAAPVTPRRHPVWHTTAISQHPAGLRGSADDVLTMHSHSGTHLDALCHYWEGQELYNGFPAADITSHGAPRLSMEKVTGIVTRGVFLDLAEACPTGADAHGFVLTPAHLEDALAAAGLTLEPGDALLLRTGWARELGDDVTCYQNGEPGIGIEAAEWLAARDVALVGADNWAVEALPPEVRGEGLLVHRHLINDCGLYLIENLTLEELAAAEGSIAGLFIIAPLRITGGAGSPVNPLLVV